MEIKEFKSMDGSQVNNQPSINQEVPLKQKVDQLYSALENGTIKVKKMRLPAKGKIKGSKAKKGWVGILRVDTNKCGLFEKQQIIDNTIKLKDGTYHGLDGTEVIMIKGKHPLIIQRSDKINPIKVFKEGEINETYGQKYVMARMLQDTIKEKKKGFGWIVWVIIIGAVIFGVNYLMNR